MFLFALFNNWFSRSKREKKGFIGLFKNKKALIGVACFSVMHLCTALLSDIKLNWKHLDFIAIHQLSKLNGMHAKEITIFDDWIPVNVLAHFFVYSFSWFCPFLFCRAEYNPKHDLLDQEFMLKGKWYQRKDVEVSANMVGLVNFYVWLYFLWFLCTPLLIDRWLMNLLNTSDMLTSSFDISLIYIKNSSVNKYP
jgi:hypothetical protein